MQAPDTRGHEQHGHRHGPAHHHANSHAHGHAHGHADSHGTAFTVAIALNLLFVSIEFVAGFMAHSTALLADAGHNLSDVLGLFLAWGAAMLARQQPSGRYTYGLRSSSILAALANAVLLFVACGAIAWEAVQRFRQPPPVAGMTVTVVAAMGIVVNGVSAWLFARGRKGDLNIRAAFLHLVADAAVSLGVVVAGLAMMRFGWNWLDPAVSLVIVVVVLVSTWDLLKESMGLALNAVPARIDAAAVDAWLRSLPRVADLHDLHIWGMSTTESALTAHLVLPDGPPEDAFLDEVARGLEQRFGIHHCTLQVERGTLDHACCLQAR